MIPAVACDYDGTLVRSTDLVCELVNYRAGTKLTAKDIRAMDSFRCVGREKEFWDAYDLLDRTGLRAVMPPYDAMTGPALALVAARWPVEIVTANDPAAGESIAAWLQHNAPHAAGLPVRCLGRVSSTEKAKLPYKVFIDDSPRLAEVLPRVRRFRSWADVPALVDRAMKWDGPTLLLANCRWNESVADKGAC